jgi:5-methylcytosine-specific restriction endonuclease McrA
MPILKLCSKCKKVIQHPYRHCPACAVVVEEQRKEMFTKRNRRYNSRRDPKYKEFYASTDWELLREKKLQDVQYRCEKCGGIGAECHHRVEIAERWDLRFEYGNIVVLCTRCHNAAHERFQKRKGVR